MTKNTSEQKTIEHDTEAQTANVDLDEIAKFEALAARWWDKDSEFKPLHAINPLRIGWIDERAQLHGKKVADIGCGGGIVAERGCGAERW